MPRYVFADTESTGEQERCLAAAYDPPTTKRLAATGVTEGWHCLEVGAGGGSVATWLAERVGPAGSVVATELRPRAEGQGVTWIEHDVVHDPLPDERFDLVHARLVLRHLPQRQAVLAKLARAVKPGGWLQVDEFDTTYGPCLLAPTPYAARLYETFLAAVATVMTRAGADRGWGRRVPAAMHRAGLTGIDPLVHIETWHAGSPGLRLLANHTVHLRERLLEAGMTATQLADVRTVLAHPALRATSCPFYSVQGRKT